jgi:hypothetical protein
MEARLDTLMKDAQIDNFLEKTTQSGRIETAAAPAAAVPTKTR